MAPRDPVTPGETAPLGARERGRARRRLRYLRRMRELALRDVGGLAFDLYRFGEQREELVRGKLDALIATDKEIAALEGLLDDRRAVLEVRQPGVGGTCPGCGAFYASDARFCADCGIEFAAATAIATDSGEEPDAIAPTPEDEAAEEAAVAEEEMPEQAEAEPIAVADGDPEGEIAVEASAPAPDGAEANGSVEEPPAEPVTAVAEPAKSGRRRKR